MNPQEVMRLALSKIMQGLTPQQPSVFDESMQGAVQKLIDNNGQHQSMMITPRESASVVGRQMPSAQVMSGGAPQQENLSDIAILKLLQQGRGN